MILMKITQKSIFMYEYIYSTEIKKNPFELSKLIEVFKLWYHNFLNSQFIRGIR